MTVSKLATALSIIFIVFLVALAAELLYVLWRHRSFLRRSSPIRNETPNSSVTDATTKELLYFFCLKPHTPVELNPTEAPNKDNDTSSPDDEVIDVFKLLDAKGPSRFLCTIKEEEKEEVESKPDVDFSNQPKNKIVCLQSRLKIAKQTETAEVEEVVTVTVDQDDDSNTKTVFSTPCDSPMFFTPVGSPSRDLVESELVVSVDETKSDER